MILPPVASSGGVASGDVHDMINRAVENYPVLHHLSVDFNSGSAAQVRRDLSELVRSIGDALEDPAQVTGFLGLGLDRKRGRVTRNGEEVHMTGDIAWALLTRLYKSGDEYCPRARLIEAWADGQMVAETAFDRAMSDLCKRLRPLCVAIRMRRDIGWRLESES